MLSSSTRTPACSTARAISTVEPISSKMRLATAYASKALASRSSAIVCASHASKDGGVSPERQAMHACAGACGPHAAGRQSASSTMYSARWSWSRAAWDRLVDFTTTAPAPARNAARTPSASIRCSAEPAISGFLSLMRPISTCVAGDMRPPSLVRSSLLLVLMDGRQPGYPRQRRAKPVLPPRHELVALAQDTNTHHVGRLLPLARRGGIDRRAAAGAEGLQPRMAALRRGLEISRRLPGHLERFPGYRNRYAERGTRARLAVR